MKSNLYTKENLTIAFYVVYIFIAGLAYELFPGDEKNPNMGVMLLYLFIPISLVYFMVHLVQQLFGNKNNTKCLVIHAVVWGSILVVLTLFGKNK
jgi:L-asparagine transporter-like permease